MSELKFKIRLQACKFMVPPRLEDNQDVKIESQKHERQNFNDVSFAYKEIPTTLRENAKHAQPKNEKTSVWCYIPKTQSCFSGQKYFFSTQLFIFTIFSYFGPVINEPSIHQGLFSQFINVNIK